MSHAGGRLGRAITDGLYYIVGSALYALAVDIFIAPNKISPGGLTGMATLIGHLTPVPIGVAMLTMNLPLMFAALRSLGPDYTIRTAIATIIVSVMIDSFQIFVPPFHGDIILAAIFGGVLSGVGIGLIYMRGGTTGGSELIARLVWRKMSHVPVGRIILAVDALVVASAATVYRNFESSMYAIILIYVTSVLIDTLIYGRNKGKMLLIVTAKVREVVDDVLKTLHRGVTILKAAGGFSGSEKEVLLCAVRPSEVYLLRTLVYDHDPDAFIVVLSTDEVLGEGFRPFNNI